MSIMLNDEQLIVFEKYVNERSRTFGAAGVPDELIPEKSHPRPMLWALVPIEEVEFISSEHIIYNNMSITRDKNICLFPIHPLEAERYSNYQIVQSGNMQITASYRTVLYHPDPGGPLSDYASSNELLMLKLHLNNPLPGVPGDRKLTKEKISKCIAFSDALTTLKSKGCLSESLMIVKEELGIVHNDCGTIVRRLDNKNCIPGFSLFSRDQRFPERDPICVDLVKNSTNHNADQVARDFGKMYAKPLIDALFSAMREGFALEMHGQNFLVTLKENGAINKVYYRDLEGVIFSSEFRKKSGLANLGLNEENQEMKTSFKRYKLFFNRNFDHDLGRFWRNLLDSFKQTGYFNDTNIKIAVNSIRATARISAKEFDVEDLFKCGSLFRFALGPYGPWYRRSSYLSCMFR